VKTRYLITPCEISIPGKEYYALHAHYYDFAAPPSLLCCHGSLLSPDAAAAIAACKPQVVGMRVRARARGEVEGEGNCETFYFTGYPYPHLADGWMAEVSLR